MKVTTKNIVLAITALTVSSAFAEQSAPKEDAPQTKAAEILGRYNDPFKAENRALRSQLTKTVRAGKSGSSSTQSKQPASEQSPSDKLIRFTLMGYTEDAEGNARAILGVIKNSSEKSAIVVKGGETLNLSPDDKTVVQYKVLDVNNDYVTITSDNNGVIEVR